MLRPALCDRGQASRSRKPRYEKAGGAGHPLVLGGTPVGPPLYPSPLVLEQMMASVPYGRCLSPLRPPRIVASPRATPAEIPRRTPGERKTKQNQRGSGDNTARVRVQTLRRFDSWKGRLQDSGHKTKTGGGGPPGGLPRNCRGAENNTGGSFTVGRM